MAIDIKLIKKLREETQVSIADCTKALTEAKGDYEKAIELLKKRGIERAEKKADRETAQGLVEAYIHQNGKVGVLLEILCETDFVARTEDFKRLAHEVAMQIAAMNPKDVAVLLKQDYIRDGSLNIETLVKQTIGKLGENIVIKQFTRFEI
jgi:elongation factor Ts